jgi:hypothetical protein
MKRQTLILSFEADSRIERICAASILVISDWNPPGRNFCRGSQAGLMMEGRVFERAFIDARAIRAAAVRAI